MNASRMADRVLAAFRSCEEKLYFMLGFSNLMEIFSFNSHTRAVTHHATAFPFATVKNFFIEFKGRKVVEVFTVSVRKLGKGCVIC